MTRDKVYAAVDTERDFQDRKWGTIEQHPHEVGAWIALMESLLAHARDAWAGNPDDREALKGIRKVVAVGVACGEQHGMQCRSKHEAGFVNMRSNDRLLEG